MNQKHMDSISLGIHMGLRAGGGGRGRIWGRAFWVLSDVPPSGQQFEVCDDWVPGRVPFSARALRQPQRHVQGPRPPQGPTTPRGGPSGPWFDATGLSVPALHRSVAETQSAPRLGARPPGSRRGLVLCEVGTTPASKHGERHPEASRPRSLSRVVPRPDLQPWGPSRGPGVAPCGAAPAS